MIFQKKRPLTILSRNYCLPIGWSFKMTFLFRTFKGWSNICYSICYKTCPDIYHIFSILFPLLFLAVCYSSCGHNICYSICYQILANICHIILNIISPSFPCCLVFQGWSQYQHKSAHLLHATRHSMCFSPF